MVNEVEGCQWERWLSRIDELEKASLSITTKAEVCYEMQPLEIALERVSPDEQRVTIHPLALVVSHRTSNS